MFACMKTAVWLVSVSPELRLVLDVLDVVLFVGLLYMLYRLLRGTIAINIFFGLLLFYLFWWVVKALDMRLLSTVLGQFIGVGVIALLIVFQQEIRRFFLWVGRNIARGRHQVLLRPWKWRDAGVKERRLDVSQVIRALNSLSRRKWGALMVVCTESELRSYAETGIRLDAELSAELLTTVFCKNGPLHDGAVIICRNRLVSAACILPLTEQPLDPQLGLRHRAAVGISEQSDAVTLVVSEETGHIAVAHQGRLEVGVTLYRVREILSTYFIWTWDEAEGRPETESVV